MKLESLDNKCPACGANIKFNPKNQMWDCEYCGSKFTLDEMKKHSNASSEEVNKKSKEKVSNLDGLDIYRCKSCGAEVIADTNTTATFCVYCGNTAILKEKITSGVAPSKIIPFKKVKEDAVDAFKGLCKGRPLMPKFFNNPNNIDKIKGVYIPFWAYDLSLSGDICFNAKDVTSWSDYDYNYVKTDRYLALRNGNMTFNKVLVDGSTRFDDDLMDSIEPFNLDELIDYNHAYLSGFLAEKYDVESDKAIERANERAMTSAINKVMESVAHQTKVVDTNSMNIKKLEDYYILLPVYMVNIKYNNKMYTFAMNGQTGEIVGDIPLDVKKTVILSIIIFIVSFILLYLVFSIGGL